MYVVLQVRCPFRALSLKHHRHFSPLYEEYNEENFPLYALPSPFFPVILVQFQWGTFLPLSVSQHCTFSIYFERITIIVHFGWKQKWVYNLIIQHPAPIAKQIQELWIEENYVLAFRPQYIQEWDKNGWNLIQPNLSQSLQSGLYIAVSTLPMVL